MTAGLKQSHYKKHQDIVWKYGGRGLRGPEKWTETHTMDKTLEQNPFFFKRHTFMYF